MGGKALTWLFQRTPSHFGSQAMTFLQSAAAQELCMQKLKMTFESAEILDLWVAWLITACILL